MSVTAPSGFVAAGGPAGIKDGGAPDFALVATEHGGRVPAAAVFTSNKVTAAPVQVSRAHLAATEGRSAGVVLTSGNANAATGPDGVAAAERLCELAAKSLGCSPLELLVCQTGLIGIPFPIQQVEGCVGPIVARRARGARAGTAAATAIMTTDTVPKEVVVEGEGFTVGGMAKGAAMLAPHMATMLAVLTTDAAVDPGSLGRALAAAVEPFNNLSVDGSTSTNDTVIVLASGVSSRAAHDTQVATSREAFEHALTEASASLARQMAADAEGATKVVTVQVSGARSHDDAARAARKIADAPLVKCSWNGDDPYWGRILSELGSVGIDVEPERISISYGGVVVCREGVAARHEGRSVAAHMAGRNIEVHCELGMGTGSATMLTTDLGHGYIDENRRTS